MSTGEHCRTRTLNVRLAEVEGAKDHAKERLRYDVNKEIGNVLEAYSEKDVVIVLGTITSEPVRPRWHWPDDGIEYRIGFIALLLNYRDAEIGDCVHTDGIVAAVGSNTARMGERTFVWEGKWWRRVE